MLLLLLLGRGKSIPFGFNVKKKNILKIVLAVMVAVLVVVIPGCSQISDLTQPSSQEAPDVVRGAKLGGKWWMDQLRVNIDAGDESLVLLKLDPGDKVDGYFYIEKGESINFQIMGDSLIYESLPQYMEDSPKITSDRFSFVATQAQGSTYTLTLRNTGDEAQMKTRVFLEVIYPIGGSLFTPLERE